MVREFGSSVGQPHVEDFVAGVEQSFHNMVKVLQGQGRCRFTMPVLHMDVNLGSNNIVHYTFMVDPARVTLPPLNLERPARCPTHGFFESVKYKFANLSRFLQIRGTLSSHPCVLSLSMCLDNMHYSFGTAIPLCAFQSSDSDTANSPSPTRRETERAEAPATANGGPPATPGATNAAAANGVLRGTAVATTGQRPAANGGPSATAMATTGPAGPEANVAVEMDDGDRLAVHVSQTRGSNPAPMRLRVSTTTSTDRIVWGPVPRRASGFLANYFRCQTAPHRVPPRDNQ